MSKDGVKCDPNKIRAVQDWKTPDNVTEITSFLGLASYYRKFIPVFATVAYPLTRLTQKNVPFAWDSSSDKAFQTLKKLLVSSPKLSYPNSNGTFVIDTDASNDGIGAVLPQIQNGEEKVIAYGSKTLFKTQRRYCTTYRELLAVVMFVKQFKQYLWGRKSLLRTDRSIVLRLAS